MRFIEVGISHYVHVLVQWEKFNKI